MSRSQSSLQVVTGMPSRRVAKLVEVRAVPRIQEDSPDRQSQAQHIRVQQKMMLVVEGRDTFNLVSRLHIAETAERNDALSAKFAHYFGP